MARPGTRVIDAAGKLVLPGFNDAHVHFIDGGASLDRVQLNDATSAQEFARRIAAQATKSGKGEWVLGGEWDETKWTPANLPTRELIDPVTPDTPVFVTRYDGHESLANSVALHLAGITAKTADPPGRSHCPRCPRQSHWSRERRGPRPGDQSRSAHDPRAAGQVVQRAMAHAASLGVTSVQHMNPDYEDIAVYSELLERGELITRIYAAPLIPQVDDQVKIGIRHAFGGPYLRLGALKAYADGSLGAGTAYFFEPYADAPNNRGLLSDTMQPLLSCAIAS